jgi:putative transposase
MDGRGRGFDTMVGERRWRRVKSEEVSRKDDRSVPEAMHGLQGDVECYTRERIQQSLNYQTPAAVYRQGPKRAAVTTFN